MKYLVLGIVSLAFFACGGGDEKNENKKNEVLIHELADPITLNPILEADANTGYILGNVYQTLLGHDRDDFKTYPLLADSLPLLTTNLQDSSMEFSFRLRKEASWDDQTPLTSEDVAFALKLFKVPTIECASLRSYFEMFDDIVLDPKNDKKFTIHCNRLYHMAEDAIGGLGLMNPKVFDPKGVLKKYTVKQLSEIKKLDANAIKELDAYAKFFNESFNNKVLAGSGTGPYDFEKWETMQRIVLKKKQNWWGAKVKDGQKYFQANPNKLVYETIKDFNNAIVKLKGGKLDVVSSIPNRDFVQDLQSNKVMQEKLHLFNPPQFAYEFFGMNMKHKKFHDVRVRKAISHLVDVDKIVEVVCYGLGERVASFVHPSKKEPFGKNSGFTNAISTLASLSEIKKL